MSKSDQCRSVFNVEVCVIVVCVAINQCAADHSRIYQQNLPEEFTRRIYRENLSGNFDDAALDARVVCSRRSKFADRSLSIEVGVVEVYVAVFLFLVSRRKDYNDLSNGKIMGVLCR